MSGAVVTIVGRPHRPINIAVATGLACGVCLVERSDLRRLGSCLVCPSCYPSAEREACCFFPPAASFCFKRADGSHVRICASCGGRKECAHQPATEAAQGTLRSARGPTVRDGNGRDAEMKNLVVWQLTSENLTGLGGRMGTERTWTNWTQLFRTKELAMKEAQRDLDKHDRGQLRREIEWKKYEDSLSSRDYGHVMYHIQQVTVKGE